MTYGEGNFTMEGDGDLPYFFAMYKELGEVDLFVEGVNIVLVDVEAPIQNEVSVVAENVGNENELIVVVQMDKEVAIERLVGNVGNENEVCNVGNGNEFDNGGNRAEVDNAWNGADAINAGNVNVKDNGNFSSQLRTWFQDM
ncbi:hypothetical protein JCGZ_08966 [Jatropha curcas]|uniref:Uncharacterized protein n=1 Tax=Jatropha curcas TaxID=180498 RepID=A0A067KKI3_JATCU|nr:hypothetical protein JCGZ_08966 [Jatropha curcas]